MGQGEWAEYVEDGVFLQEKQVFWKNQVLLFVKSVLVYMYVAVINAMAKGKMGMKGFISYCISRLRSIFEGSQAGTQGKNLQAETEAEPPSNTAYWLVPQSAFLYNLEPVAQGKHHPHHPHHPHQENVPHRLAYRPIYGGIFAVEVPSSQMTLAVSS